MTDTVPVQDCFITLNGLRFHYRDWGALDAQPLVVLHGFSTHSHGWDGFARAMSDVRRIVVLDQRGHGETEWAADYAWERWIEDVDALIQELNLGRVDLLGHSMGGAHAYRFAALHSEAVARLVVVDDAPYAAFSPVFLARMAAHRTPDVVDDPEDAVRALLAIFPRADPSAARDTVLPNWMQRDDGRWTLRYDPALRSLPEEKRHLDAASSMALLPRITCPTLLVRGAQSEYLSRDVAEAMASAVPNCRLVEVADSDHAIPVENLDGLLSVVRPFLLSV